MDIPSKNFSAAPDPRRWIALAVLCVAFFMVCLDGQIVLLALPSIEAQLGFTPSAVQWVMSAYMLALGGLLLLGGRVSDLLGRRRLFMASTAAFLVASLACGLSGNPGFLIGARVVQGIAAAVLTPSALSILMTTFEGNERNRALGLWSAMGAGGATAALLVGGPLADWPGWRWVFFINVPICAMILGLSPFTLRESRAIGSRGGFDLGGAVTITAALVAFVLAITEVPSVGWAHPKTLGLLGATLGLLGAFVLIERRVNNPLVPLAIFRSRSFVGGNLTMLFAGALVFGMALLVSLYAQKVLGYSPLVVGLGTMIYAILSIVSSTLTGKWIGRAGARAIAVIAMLLMGAGCALFTFIVPEGTYLAHLLPGLIAFGPGIGMAAVAGSVAALSKVKEADAGLASGINSAMFQIGAALGVAITATVAVSMTGTSDTPAALTAGYAAGFWACVIIAATGATLALLLLSRDRTPAPAPVHVGV
ncbi:MFS transporter [Mesorhizobium sp. M0815]|uniref:MFS transporter n=1 Tax=unclassified Mesorhizobium TaxID=325217 RepID=UPI0033365ED9